MQYVLGSLILLFAVGDLIGQANLTRLERALLQRSENIFTDWMAYFSSTIKWWKVMLSVGLLNILVAMLASLGIGSIWFIMNDSLEILHRVLIGVLGVMCGVVAFFINDRRATYNKNMFSSSTNAYPPLESRLMSCLTALPESGINWVEAQKAPSAEVLTFVFVLCAGVSGIISSVLISISLAIRGFVLFMGILTWIIFFLPFETLDRIKQRTGSDSLINVGKYILLIIATLFTWLNR
jgi:hypothetical protein